MRRSDDLTTIVNGDVADKHESKRKENERHEKKNCAQEEFHNVSLTNTASRRVYFLNTCEGTNGVSGVLSNQLLQ